MSKFIRLKLVSDEPCYVLKSMIYKIEISGTPGIDENGYDCLWTVSVVSLTTGEQLKVQGFPDDILKDLED